MKISLLYGPPKSGKSAFLAKYFANNIDKNPIILVPASENIAYIKKMIFSETALQGMLGHRVITFDHIVNAVTSEHGLISKFGKYFLLRDIVGKMKLNYFEPIKHTRGFYEILARFISELKSGEIMPDDFLKGINNKGNTKKDLDIYNIYSAYQDVLKKHNIYDHEGLFWQAQKLISEGAESVFGGCKILLVDGFNNFSPAQLKIIKSLNNRLDELFFSLTIDPNPDEQSIYFTTNKTRSALKNAFPHIIEKELSASKRSTNAELCRDIKLTAYPGTEREADCIAKEVKRLIIHSSNKPWDIAVVFRKLSHHKFSIINSFNKYGIPFSISEGIPLNSSHTIKLILNEFIAQKDLPPLAIFNYYFQRVKDTSKILEIEEKLINCTDTLIKNDSLSAYLTFFDALEEFQQFIALAGLSNNKISVREFYDDVLNIIENTEYKPEPSPLPKVSIMDAHSIRGLSFPIIFLGGLNEQEFPIQVQEEPLYGDYERIKLREHGVNVEEAKDLQKDEKFLFYSAVKAASQRLYLSYSTMNSAGGEELPSYYIDEFKKSLDAPIITSTVSVSDVIPLYEDVFNNEELLLRYNYNKWHKISDIFDDPTKKDFFVNYSNMVFSNSILANTRPPEWNGILTNADIQKTLYARFTNGYRFSVSQFNEYGTCPFAFFCKRILGIKQIEEIDDEIKQVDEGNVYHSILWEYYTKRRDSGNADLSATCDKYFKIAEEQNLIKNKSLWKIKKEEVARNIAKLLEYEAGDEQNFSKGRVPSYFELAFGMPKKNDTDINSSEKPLVIGDVQIQGKIDRVDLVSKEFFIVVDYKTGRKHIPLTEIERGTNIQLPIYVLAVKNVFDVGIDALEAYFCFIKRKKFYYSSPLRHHKKSGKTLKEDPKWDDYLNYAMNYVKDYAEKIRSGIYPPKPGYECPKYCEYSGICRYAGESIEQNE